MFRTLATLLLLPLLATASDTGVPNIEACRADPMSRCMTDIGIALARGAPSVSSHRLYHDLVALGRMDEAEEIAGIQRYSRGRYHGEMDLAEHRIIARLASGEDLDSAIEATPLVHYLALWHVADQLQSRETTERLGIDEAQAVRLAAEVATLLVERGDNQPSVARAATIFLALGDTDRAHWALQSLPDRRLGGYAVEIDFRAIGPEAALNYLRSAGGLRPKHLLEAARVQEDPALAREYLAQGFSELVLIDLHSRYDEMEEFASYAHDRGFGSLAERFVAELRDAASEEELRPRKAYARALVATSASDAAIQSAIDDVAAVGDDGWRYAAALWALAGDTEEASAMLSGSTGSARELYWAIEALPFPASVAFLDSARPEADPADVNLALAFVIVGLMEDGLAPAELDWARRTAEEVLAAPQMYGIFAWQSYLWLANLDPALTHRALTMASESAFELWLPSFLIEGARAWHGYENRL